MLSSGTDGVYEELLAQPAPGEAGGHFYPLTVRSVQQETVDAVVVTFEVPRQFDAKFRFVQGQYLTLRVWIGGEEVRRSYSICSAVQDRVLRIAIKRTTGGIFSSWAMENLRAGSVVEVMPPEGRFYVPLCAEQAKNYLAFAAGSGITPVLSIIRTTLFAEPGSTFTLFYGNRTSNTIMFREELAELKDLFLDRFSVFHIMSREQQDLDLLNGRITDEKAEQLVRHFVELDAIDTVFLCGPQEMSEAIAEKLKAMGFPPGRIKIELFTVGVTGTAIEKKASVAPGECEVTIVADGAQHTFVMEKDYESVLDAGLRRGIDLRHSCKSGVCATCRAKLVEGRVEMDANYALGDDEIARGFILTCQSHPVTSAITVDFDQDS